MDPPFHRSDLAVWDERFLLRPRRLGIDCNNPSSTGPWVTFLDTSDFYGPHTNEVLIGRAIAGRRDQVFLATKFGFVPNPSEPGQIVVDGSPAYIRKAIEGSLQRLGVETIDLYYQHRVDPNTPIEETVGALSDLVREGKVRYIGLRSRRGHIERAHRVHAITAVPDRVLSLDPRS
jgi:aryl-alcohol dehydrogenase-like predicted oxidoreductase